MNRSDRLAVQLDYVAQHPDVDVFSSWCEEFVEGEARRQIKASTVYHASVVAALRWRNVLVPPSTLMRAAAIRKVGGYRSAYDTLAEYDLYVRLGPGGGTLSRHPSGIGQRSHHPARRLAAHMERSPLSGVLLARWLPQSAAIHGYHDRPSGVSVVRVDGARSPVSFGAATDQCTMPKLIINGDDFGLSAENNAGIIAAHRNGGLTGTSLMMGGDAAQEAIELARQHPKLAVGLHVSFSDTKPVLGPELVPLLVLSNGYFPPDDAAHRKALRSREGRRQLRAEITAQFRAFAATGLTWDHVNSHRHFHRFPPLAMMLFREAATLAGQGDAHSL